MTTVLTNLIESIECDHDALQKRFSVICICYKSWSEQQQKKQLPELPGRIYKTGTVLALVHHWQEKRYWVLLPAGATLEMADDHLRCRSERLELVPDWALASLLVRAIPRTLGKPDKDATRFEADGLYYVIRHNKTRLPGSSELVTVSIDVQWSKAARQHHLAIKTTTFTPLELHADAEGKLPARITRAPRYQLDMLGQSLSRHARGDYVKKALWHKTKNRVSAFKLDGVVSLESYYKTRLGTLSLFLADLQHAYGGLFKINLRHIQPDQRIPVATNLIEQHYRGIFQQLGQQPIRLVNQSDDPAAGNRLCTMLEKYGITPVISTTIATDELNLLLVNDRDQYENSAVDPYRIARQQNPTAVIQSCYPDSLDTDDHHVVEVLLKELFIKLESRQAKLQGNYPSLPDDAWFVTSIRPEGKIEPDAPWPMFRVMVHGQNLDFVSVSAAEQEQIRDDLAPEQASAVFNGLDRSDLVYWPATGDALIMSDTGALSLPDEPAIHGIVKEMDYTLSQGVPARLLQQYCSLHPGSAIAASLAQLLDEHPGQVPVKAFKSLTYRNKEARAFYDYLTAQGYRIKASLQTKNTGALSITTGFWFDLEHNLYSAGSPGSAQRKQDNFNHIYRVDSNGIQVPGWFWSSLQVWHIRHRGTTVYPYIFKHVKEYGQRQCINKNSR